VSTRDELLRAVVEDILMNLHGDVAPGWVCIPIGEWEGSIRPRLEVIVVDLLHEHERRLAAYQKGYTDGLYGREPTPCA